MTFEVVLTFIEGTFFVTLIVTVLVALLYLEVAAAVRVIFAVPAFFIVILPVLLTETTEELLDLYVIVPGAFAFNENALEPSSFV